LLRVGGTLDDQQPWPFSPKGEAAAEIRTGANASKQELTQTDLARFRFVHFATYGIPVEALYPSHFRTILAAFRGVECCGVALTVRISCF